MTIVDLAAVLLLLEYQLLDLYPLVEQILLIDLVGQVVLEPKLDRSHRSNDSDLS